MTHRPDRERIIKECDWAIARIEDYGSTTMLARSFFADVKELLKEQEAVEPIKPLDKDDDYTFMCSNCKGELFCGDIIRDNFCPTCGKPVKWE